jgi:SP family general alpha glucoside:H+ symporter-like MFS transporter
MDRQEEAVRAVERLGRRSRINGVEVVAMMRRVVQLEATEKAPGYIELFKSTDLRRTLIVSCVYAGQNLAGNLIANQAVYFFERTFF